MAHLAAASRRSSKGVRDRPVADEAPRGSAPRRDRLTAVWIVAAGLLVVEVASRAGVVASFYFPPPSAVLATAIRSFAAGELSAHLLATMGRVVPGFALGVVPGIGLGLLMGRSARLRRAVDPLIAAAHPVPKIALLPLFMVLLGIGEAPRITIIALAAFFPSLISAMAGVRGISPLYLDVARSYGASRWRTVTRVLLPGSLPVALSGIRLSVNASIVVSIAIEIAMAEKGLGALVWLSWEILDTRLLYATIVVTALLGITLNAGLNALGRALVPWSIAEEA